MPSQEMLLWGTVNSIIVSSGTLFISTILALMFLHCQPSQHLGPSFSGCSACSCLPERHGQLWNSLPGGPPLELEFCTETNYAWSVVDRQATAGYITVNWHGKKQVIPLSSTEAEFQTLRKGVCDSPLTQSL